MRMNMLCSSTDRLGDNMLFDAHTHLNETSLKPAEKEKFIRSIEDEGMMICDIGFDLESSMNACSHANMYDWCYAAVGSHPHDADNMDDMQLELIKGLARREKVVAIGEIGLDFFKNYSERDNQEYWFRKQIRLANELKMPIAIHERDAVQPVMQILKEEGAFSDERKSWFPKRPGPGGKMTDDARVVIHCFSASKEIALQYAAMGATISVAGPITYKNNRKTKDACAAVPIEYLLIETDAPYLTPEPHRGKRNVPAFVKYTAQEVADIKGMEYEDVVRITCENARRFYGI